VGSRKITDRQLVESAGFKFKSIPAGKLRRYWTLQNLWDILATGVGFFISLGLIIQFWPDRIFIKGGYVGVPMGLAAWLLRRPIILHESDARIGLANKLLMPLAKWVCVAFPYDSYNLPKSYTTKLIHTGIPLSEIFYQSEISNNTGIPLNDNKPMILVIGGSQGARAINQVIKTILPNLVQNYLIFHLAGKTDFASIKEWAEAERFRNYYLFENLPNEQIAYLMRRAAIIISRAGATAIAEIAASARPVILVPLPESANNHQLRNAEYLADRGAAILVRQEDFIPEVIQEWIFKILNSDLGSRLVFNIKQITQKGASEKIAELILQ